MATREEADDHEPDQQRPAVLGATGPPTRAGQLGFYRSSVLTGFRLRVGWLWERPQPTVADVLAQTES